jgi:RNA polymerase sigma factor (TIGR02999 family)
MGTSETGEAAAGQTTLLLHAWREGDAGARDALIPLVYEELRRLAARQLRRERRDHTLQATELVHEAFLRLAGADADWRDRAHFLAVAARAMRRVLVDHARARQRQKRSGGSLFVTLDTSVGTPKGEAQVTDIIALDRALRELEEHDPRKARAIELCLFAGLTGPEAATALGVSEPTVRRDLRMARAWLTTRLT